jgi:hypothetical protein
MRSCTSVGANLEPFGDERVALAHTRRMGVAQPYERAAIIQRRPHDASGVELVDGARILVLYQEGQQALIVHVQALQQGGHGVAPADPGLGDEWCGGGVCG